MQKVHRLNPGQLQAAQGQQAAGILLRGDGHDGVVRAAPLHNGLLLRYGERGEIDAEIAEFFSNLRGIGKTCNALVKQGQAYITDAAGIVLHADVDIVGIVRLQVWIAFGRRLGRRIRKTYARQHVHRIGPRHGLRKSKPQIEPVPYLPDNVK